MKQPSYIVLRYTRVTYHGVSGIELHGKRLGGDLSNIDPTRTHLNEFPIGGPDLRQIVDAHIAAMQKDNAALKRASLKRRRRRSEQEALDTALEEACDSPHALAQVVGWPWDPKNVRPFTEGILSVSHDWFLDSEEQIDPAKIDTFRSFALGYLEEEFGDEVLYARLDLDEKTPHLSFLLAPEHKNGKTGRRELSHRQHRLFGMKELRAFFEGEEPEPSLTRGSYELLQDRVADYAASLGLELVRGQHRAEQERLLQEQGKAVAKRKNVSPSRGREIAAREAAEAANDRKKAASLKAAAERDAREARKQSAEATRTLNEAKTVQTAASEELHAAQQERAELAAREKAIRVGTQALISEELAYAPPNAEKAEGLKWGRNRPESEQRRTWLVEAIKPAAGWLIGFARSIYGFVRERDSALAEQKARAEAILKAERRQGRAPSQTMVDLMNEVDADPRPEVPIPGAWALPRDMTAKQIDAHLAAMTNADLCNAYAPTRDARDLTEHSDMQRCYAAGLHHLLKEARRRGVDVELREFNPTKATDPKRAELHGDLKPMPIRVRRRDRTRTRTRGDARSGRC